MLHAILTVVRILLGLPLLRVNPERSPQRRPRIAGGRLHPEALERTPIA